MDCYHAAIRAQIKARGPGCIYPEEYRWIISGCPSPPCTETPCVHWPIFTVVAGSPYKPYHGAPETYAGFRSDPRPLMGVLRLNTPEDETDTKANQAYLRERLGGTHPTARQA